MLADIGVDFDFEGLLTALGVPNYGNVAKRIDRATANVTLAVDPNEISGPVGFGPERFVDVTQTLPYTISFENLDTAALSAVQVVITHALDDELDLDTFELGDLGFGDVVVDVPAGLDFFETRLDLSATESLFLDITAGLNRETRVATWSFVAIDPKTGDIVFDPDLGFLPPNVDGTAGTGFVDFLVRPRSDTVTGDVIEAQASIVFDENAAIATSNIFNTIDAQGPASSVDALPAISASAAFDVSWSGQDDAGGSGVNSFNVFVSDDGAPFRAFLLGTTATSATFAGEDSRRGESSSGSSHGESRLRRGWHLYDHGDH